MQHNRKAMTEQTSSASQLFSVRSFHKNDLHPCLFLTSL